ncbi:MAG: cytochrome D1 domain-containing protein [Chloroflexota bacterium]
MGAIRTTFVGFVIALTACSSTTIPTASPRLTATPSPSPVPSPSPTVVPTPEPTPVAGMGTVARIMVETVQVAESPGGALSSDVVHAGELVRIIGGPFKITGTRWWRVSVAALDGWVSEGDPAQPNLLDSSAAASRAWNVWSATSNANLQPSVADLPGRVFVPNEADSTISVIDAASFKVIATLGAGKLPEHLTPDWDMSRLYVSNYASPFLTVVDPRTETVISPISAPSPYNLYFSPDGSTAIVMAEDVNRIDFYDRRTWKLLGKLPIKWAGIDHADFSAGGRYFVASTEYAPGHLLKVDVVTMSIVGDLEVGGKPIDVKLSPDGSVFFVTNQGRHGVSVVDPMLMKEIAFIPTAKGAHGMAISRDTRSLYVSNRLAGTISVIDFATRTVTATWQVGGSPDMLQVSPDGSQLWTGNRYNNTVVVFDTTTGTLVATIIVGRQPHGLTYFPQPGRFSIGHNGVYR